MSFESTIQKAELIASYIKMFENGELDKLFKKCKTMYLERNTNDSWVVYTKDDETIIFSDYFPKRGYISYTPDEVLKIFNPDWEEDQEYELLHEIPFNEITQNWDNPEFYFQQSTVYDDYTLDNIVMMWYFYKNNYSAFYMDFENVQISLGSSNES